MVGMGAWDEIRFDKKFICDFSKRWEILVRAEVLREITLGGLRMKERFLESRYCATVLVPVP